MQWCEAMEIVKADPPGMHCICEAVRDVAETRTETFVDVGSGGGNISRLLWFCDGE